MRPTTLNPVSHDQATSTATDDVKTFTAPAGASACYLACTTTSAWITLDGSTPATDNRLLLTKDLPPVRIDVASDINFVSADAANSVVDIAWVS